MKKILWLSILLSTLFAGHAFAAYTLNVPTPAGSTITATLTGVSATSTSSFQLQVQTAPFSATAAPVQAAPGGALSGSSISAAGTADPSVQKPSNGTVTWSLSENPNTTYYVQVLELPALPGTPTWATGSQTVKTGALSFPTLTTSLQGSSIQISGAFDPTKQSNYANYTETLTYSTSANLSNPIQAAMPSVAGTALGSYYWMIPVSPNTTYYAQQTITVTGTTNQFVDPAIINFDGGTGAAMSSATVTSLLNTQSYTLLSGFPGLSVLPDPPLCAREQAAGNAPAFCNINDVLNYFLKLMIGLSGVALVFRLMWEGYQYMMTDVPFLKASSKAGFFTALGGLVLALSAYLILNTINPKLVSDSNSIAQLSIGVAGGDTNAPTTFLSKAQIPTGIYCPNSGRSGAISQIAQSYQGHVTYSQAIPKGAVGSDGFIRLDCSGYANTVLECAGYTPGTDYINDGSAGIFANAESVTMSSGFTISGSNVLINNKQLNPGDLVGWTPSQGGGNGHVIIYIGNATFADSHSSTTPGGAIGIYSASTIQSLYGGNRANDTIHEVSRRPFP